MKKILFLSVFLIFFDFFVKNEKKAKNDSEFEFPKAKFVKELKNYKELKGFIEKNSRFMIEIYSPYCHHCFEFAEKFEKIAKNNRKKIQIIRVDGSDPAEYIEFFRLNSFPALIYYEEGNLIPYNGPLEENEVETFLKSQMDFECKMIEMDNFEGLFKENGDLMIFGVFKEKNEKGFRIFSNLVKKFKGFIGKCFYVMNLKNKDNEIFGNKSVFDNYLYAFNGEEVKNFDLFSELTQPDNVIRSNEDIHAQLMKKTELKFGKFLKKHLFPKIETFDINNIYQYNLRKETLIIFSYENEKEKLNFSKIAKRLYLNKKIDKNFTYILLFNDLNKKINNKFLDYFEFSKNVGVFLLNPTFNGEESLTENISYESILEVYKSFTNNNNKGFKVAQIKENSGQETDSSGSRKTYVPKIVDKIEDDEVILGNMVSAMNKKQKSRIQTGELLAEMEQLMESTNKLAEKYNVHSTKTKDEEKDLTIIRNESFNNSLDKSNLSSESTKQLDSNETLPTSSSFFSSLNLQKLFIYWLIYTILFLTLKHFFFKTEKELQDNLKEN